MTARTKDFKIGSFHGKLLPEDQSSEAKLRNDLYLVGRFRINLTRTKKINIRLIGYEIPLGRKGDRLDLIGYDEDHNPYATLPNALRQSPAHEWNNAIISKAYCDNQLVLCR